ncbi:GAP family protein [Streptomyces sp. NPDC057682]|uniref:GAP family protein n=1 Tax=Streptomyces sp. NPDC057682 TaxID=3346210 RepID=UPI0036B1C181
MWTALGDALPLATGLALSPLAVITGVVLLLGDRGRTKTAMFGLGWFVAIYAVAALALWVVEAAEDTAAQETADGVDIVQLAFAVLFLALAYLIWRKRPSSGEPVPQSRLLARLNNIGIPGSFVLGLAQGVVLIQALPLSLGAGARLGEAGLEGTDAVVSLLIFSLVATAGVLVPLAVALVAGERLTTPLRNTRQWLEENMAAVTITILVILSGYFMGQGFGVLD